jgi:hypothetical protein
MLGPIGGSAVFLEQPEQIAVYQRILSALADTALGHEQSTEWTAMTWRKSSYSGSTGTCVEVEPAPTEVWVRDTKDRASGSLAFGAVQWDALLDAVQAT